MDIEEGWYVLLSQLLRDGLCHVICCRVPLGVADEDKAVHQGLASRCAPHSICNAGIVSEKFGIPPASSCS